MMELDSNDLKAPEVNPAPSPRPLTPIDFFGSREEDTITIPRNGSLATSSNNFKGLVNNIIPMRFCVTHC
jgi:hypothetical protein